MPVPNILIVEDNPDLLHLTKVALETKSYNVWTAKNGQEALELIESEGLPNLILLDMRMPVMDGWEFTKEFSNRYGRSSPIIIMTAAEDSITRATEVGADSYIGKPFELEELYGLIENVLSK